VGGTPSVGEESRQPHSRIKRSLSLSWFDRNAPESALSEMFVFDHALRQTSLTDYTSDHTSIRMHLQINIHLS